MKITINTDVLHEENLSLGDFLALLIGFYDLDYKDSFYRMIETELAAPNVFHEDSLILSDNTKNLVARLLMASADKAKNSGIDFNSLAKKLQSIYPSGLKPGTTYSWKDTEAIIAFKLMTLFVKYDFAFTEEEAIKATEEYVNSFKDQQDRMMLLKYFILKTTKSDDGLNNVNSMFMTIIENNRQLYEDSTK